MTKIIGLTGGIGSGKSTVAGYFKELGVPVYIADDEAKKLMDSPEMVKKIQSVFEENITEDNRLNKKKMADIVFSDPEQLNKLNSIVHPEVRNHFISWVKAHKNHPFVVKEAAILFESGSYKDCDKIILVTAPKEIRIQRVMNRDKVTENQVLERIENQWPDEKKIPLSDYIIQNIDFENAKISVGEILKELNKM
ncbi:dephospho-CoA kinase [Flavobacterium limnosediminis JC2902]|uniref:Dephospho-CoA kinase n=1 Tax=Flavobacterium limnosediminis JC2902 TaxID=1341181 RepID=V6SID8_9FLAO|nr:dephospho-CoA kinase [Flavobacterium limnosediminis]ESU26473.1 dephospho-CoA kinase [Flavobacterium limnosediminis JC2902]